MSPARPPARPDLEQRSLFDLELRPGSGEDEPELEPDVADDSAVGDEETVVADTGAIDAERSAPLAPRWASSGTAARIWAALADLVAQTAVLVAVLAGLFGLGVPVGRDDTLPLLLLMVVFSLFYSVVPLAFWGSTPGMAIVGLACRSLDGQALSFPQATRRWLAGWLTVLSGGLLGLVALTGRSFADRVSGSEILPRPSA